MAATTSRMPEQYQPLQEEEVDDVPFTPLKALQNVGVQQAGVAKVLQHAFKGEAEATLQITPGGIDDAKD